MDANVYRSAPNAHYHAASSLIAPHYATLGPSLSARNDGLCRDYLDGHCSAPHSDTIYRSGRHYGEQYSTSSRDLVDLVRKYVNTSANHCLNGCLTSHRTNQNASLSNSSIRTVDHDTLIQPKVCFDGRYPVDFSAPMRLPNFMSLSEIKLDDLLDDYEVSTHEDLDFGGRHYSRTSDFDGRVQKLAALLDFLGARQIADVLRSEVGGLSSRSRPLLAGSGRRFTSSR